MVRSLVIALVTLAALPVFADVTGPSGRTVECYCTDRTGSRVELGEFICMQVDGRMFMAQCQMSLNSPMWREIAPGCLSSSVRDGLHGPQSVNPSFDPLAVYPKI
jgi:hypothetical protein